MVVAMESNMESLQTACTLNACHEWVSHKRGNIFLDLLGNICSMSAGPGIAKMLLQLSLQLTLVPQLWRKQAYKAAGLLWIPCPLRNDKILQ